MLAKLVLLAVLSAAEPVPAAPGTDITVRGSAARPAIERILKADNLDVDRLPPGETAALMSDIRRGAAPLEFWIAYQAHVEAWQDYAAARDRSRRANPTDIDAAQHGAAIGNARRRIESTFDKVVEIARRYKARLPASPTRFGS